MRGKASPPLPLSSGVPQGSVLGPLLFSLSISDVQENLAGSEVVQFADDCMLVIPLKAGEDPIEATQQNVQNFDHCAANRDAADPDKCK